MKIDSFKIIKYIFYILCIISLFFSIKKNVKANEIDSYWLTTNDSGFNSIGSSYFKQFDNVKGYQYFEMVPTNVSLKGKEKLIFAADLAIYNTTTYENIYFTNISWQETCNSWSIDHMNYTITYADGTHAQVNGNYDIANVCNNYVNQGTINGSIQNTIIDIRPNIHATVIMQNTTGGNVNAFQCLNNGNTFSCDIPSSGWTLVKFGFWFDVGGTNNTYRFYILRNFTLANGDATSIINNNNQNTNTIKNSIQDTNNTLKDSSIDNNNTSSNTSNWGNMNASNGVITNLLTLPIQLMQGYVNGLNSSCTPFNLGNLFGTDITLPCINIGNLIGSALWGVIDVLFSGFMIFGIAKKLIKIFNDFTNMRGNQVDELYGGGA